MIELEFYIPEAPEKVWQHLTLQKHMAKWWTPEIYLEPHRGGKFVERWKDEKGTEQIVHGKVTAIEPGCRLQLDWQEQDWPRPTRVEILLKATDQGTTIYLQHSGWDIFEKKERQKKVDTHAAGWAILLEKLLQHCTNMKD